MQLSKDPKIKVILIAIIYNDLVIYMHLGSVNCLDTRLYMLFYIQFYNREKNQVFYDLPLVHNWHCYSLASSSFQLTSPLKLSCWLSQPQCLFVAAKLLIST